MTREEILARLAHKLITRSEAEKQLKEVAGWMSATDLDFYLTDAENPANIAEYPLEATDPASVSGRQKSAYEAILPLSRERTAAGRQLATRAAQQARFGGGSFSDFAQQAMDRSFNSRDLMSRFLLDRLGTQQADAPFPTQAPTGSFEGFARRAPIRGDADVQSRQLRNILSELEGFQSTPEIIGDPRMEFRQALQGAFANPDTAYNAALQPAAFLGQAGRDYEAALATDPGRFTTAAGSFRHFDPYFRDRTPRGTQ
jgi:hypothetical protein